MSPKNNMYNFKLKFSVFLAKYLALLYKITRIINLKNRKLPFYDVTSIKYQ